MRLRAMVPSTVRTLLKTALRPEFRERRREERRLARLPRYVGGTTRFLGHEVAFVDALTFQLMVREIFEREQYRFQTRAERPLIIDGGANIGLSVIYFKRLFPASRVVAFEPDPRIFSVLERNCSAFALAEVSLVPSALWTGDGTIHFQPEGSLAGRAASAGAPGAVEVPAVRLRPYLTDGPVAMLKLDIEGAETAVLSDCADALANVENIFVEHHSMAGSAQDVHVVVELLHAAGFRLYFEPAAVAGQPFIARTVICGMDVQTNIFGFRV
jgi:FkbM family methyltransferase